MIFHVLTLIAGMALIIAGGNYVTNGAVAVANRCRLSPMVIGLTVVAMGSSTPDLAVSMLSTIHGKADLAVGNIIGAVIFDILLVIGVMAIIKPIRPPRDVIRFDFPVMTIGAIILLLCAEGHLIDRHGIAEVSRTDALLMLLVFAVFMTFTVSGARKEHTANSTAGAHPQAHPKSSMWLAAVMIVGGLGALVAGGELTVNSASYIARKAGMSEALIGLTIVGIGSSLPDLATSLIATTKGQNGLAVGNIVGSCIMDILLVIGACGTVHPLGISGISPVDFIALAAAALLVSVAVIAGKRITRAEGVILVLLYIVYMSYLIIAR